MPQTHAVGLAKDRQPLPAWGVRAAAGRAGRGDGADRARNLASGGAHGGLFAAAPLALGEAWHNNHHAFPTSARHALRCWELDPGAWLIAVLERAQLAWDVIRISHSRQAAKRGIAVAD